MYLVQMCTNVIHYPKSLSCLSYYRFDFRDKNSKFTKLNTQLGFRG